MKFFVFVSLVFSFFLKANVDYEKEINKLLTSMTVEEKVGQIMMVEISHITPEEVKDYSIGAILNGGGSFPYGKKNHSIKIGKPGRRIFHCIKEQSHGCSGYLGN